MRGTDQCFLRHLHINVVLILDVDAVHHFQYAGCEVAVLDVIQGVFSRRIDSPKDKGSSQADKLPQARGIIEQPLEKNMGDGLLDRLILFGSVSVEVLPEGATVTAPPLSVGH